MYQFEIRPRFGRELSAQQPKQLKVSQVNRNSSQSTVSFLLSFLSTKRRIGKVTLALLTGCVVSVLAGCGGVTYNSSASALALSTISCGTQSLTGAQSLACSVNLSTAATKSTTVTLTSSNAALNVPATVVVAAGANTAGFNAISEAVSKSVSVTIAAAAGSITKTAIITLYPVAASAPTPTLSKVSCGTQTLTGPTTDSCSVYLSAAATSQTEVTLSSSSSALQAPTSVNVPAGETNVGFNVTASAVSSTQKATLTATADGVSQMDAITLSPAGSTTPPPVATLNKISCATQTLTGPTTDSCSVYLNAAATSQTVVTLSSSNNALTVPASATVPAGSSSATFSATASAVTSAVKATLTATAGSVSQTDVIQLDTAAAQPSTQHEVQLNWDAPTPTSDPVVGYNVYRATSGTSNYALVSSSPDTLTSYDDSTVTSGVTYNYVVKSVDSEGVESAPSNSTSVTVP